MSDDRNDLVTVGVFGHPDEAALARNLLESIGIRAVLGEENSASLGWALTGAQGGIRLLVARADAESARDFLDEKPWKHSDDDDDVEPTAIATPRTLSKIAAAEREDDDEKLTPREKDATRAVKSAVFGLIMPPLLIYAAYLLLIVCTGTSRLKGPPRRHAYFAGLLLIGLPLFFVIMIVTSRMRPPDDPNDLRQFKHPEILVGKWQGKRILAGGEMTIDMDLAADGRLRFRTSGANELDATGSWAFDNFSLLIRLEKISKGVDGLGGKIGGWEMEKTNGDELLLKEGNETLRMVRR